MTGALIMFGVMALLAGLVTLLDGIAYRRRRNAHKH
jgi:hypothetical protein